MMLWYLSSLGSIQKEAAQMVLKGLAKGSFLVRYSSDTNFYTV